MQNQNNVNLHILIDYIYPTYKCKIGLLISKVDKADIIHLSNGCLIKSDSSCHSPEGLPEENLSGVMKELFHSKPMDNFFLYS